MVFTRSMARAEEYECAKRDPNKFVFFCKLPPEIRGEIWKFARPEGRYIVLKLTKKGQRSAMIVSPAKVPSLLHACRESRYYARKWYELCFATRFRGSARTYFDPTRDGVFMQCGPTSGDCGALNVRNRMDDDGFKLVKRIIWQGPLGYLPLVPLMTFPYLTDLVLVRGMRENVRAEVTLEEMVVNLAPLWNNNMTIDEHWKAMKGFLRDNIAQLGPDMQHGLKQLSTVTRMDLPELRDCQNGDGCACCFFEAT